MKEMKRGGEGRGGAAHSISALPLTREYVSENIATSKLTITMEARKT